MRWFRIQRFLDADAAADMLAREHSGFSVDASVRIALIDRDVPSSFQSLEHLLRYCARHQSRLLLLMVLAARPTPAEVPLANLSLTVLSALFRRQSS